MSSNEPVSLSLILSILTYMLELLNNFTEICDISTGCSYKSSPVVYKIVGWSADA